MESKQFNCPQRFMNLEEKDQWRGDDTCSYCGSLSPEKLFEAIEAGAELGPTDKNYKVYVSGAGFENKFYFQHLSVEEQARFVTLLNERKVNVGYPGHFYVLPFFCERL